MLLNLAGWSLRNLSLRFIEHHAVVRPNLNLTFWALLTCCLFLFELILVVVRDLCASSFHDRVLVVFVVWAPYLNRVDCVRGILTRHNVLIARGRLSRRSILLAKGCLQMASALI